MCMSHVHVHVHVHVHHVHVHVHVHVTCDMCMSCDMCMWLQVDARHKTGKRGSVCVETAFMR